MLSAFRVHGFPFLGFHIAFPFTRSFVTLDGLGFHVRVGRFEAALTRGFGWVVG